MRTSIFFASIIISFSINQDAVRQLSFIGLCFVFIWLFGWDFIELYYKIHKNESRNKTR